MHSRCSASPHVSLAASRSRWLAIATNAVVVATPRLGGGVGRLWTATGFTSERTGLSQARIFHQQNTAKTYNTRDSHVVTHCSTSRAVQCLSTAERTHCLEFALARCCVSPTRIGVVQDPGLRRCRTILSVYGVMTVRLAIFQAPAFEIQESVDGFQVPSLC